MDFQETILEGRDGARLFVRSMEPAEGAVANVIHVHGMGEHSARYFHVARHFVEQGCRFCTFDLRGHGRSKGRRGWIASYSELLDDLDLVWKSCRRDAVPAFLYGHSLGGQIAVNFLAERHPDASGAVIASPWFDLAFQPGPLKLVLAKVASRVWPAFTQATGLDLSLLSRDVEFLRAMPDLHLVHRRMSARMFAELTKGAQAAREKAQALALPLLLVQGASDPVTSVRATRDFFEELASRDKALKIYPQSLHETHNDFDREQVLADITAWIRARV